MNCKPGDLAVVVRSVYGNEGQLLRILAPSRGNGLPAGAKYTDSRGITWARSNGFCWEVESLSPHGIKKRLRTYRFADVGDRYLRPIRPGDINDEEVRELFAPKLPEVA
jgi:hypothetical protein